MANPKSSLRFVKWEKYVDFYGDILDDQAAKSRRKGGLPAPIRLLGIGVFDGGSLNLWRRYFGEEAIIYGIDVDPSCANLAALEAEVRIGSQSAKGFLDSVLKEMGGVDIVIDDCSHLSEDVIASFLHLFPKLESPRHCFIEDLHTTYWPRSGGGLRRRGSSVEVLQKIVDVTNSFYFGREPTKKSM